MFNLVRCIEDDNYNECVQRIRTKKRALERDCRAKVATQQSLLTKSINSVHNVPLMTGQWHALIECLWPLPTAGK